MSCHPENVRSLIQLPLPAPSLASRHYELKAILPSPFKSPPAYREHTVCVLEKSTFYPNWYSLSSITARRQKTLDPVDLSLVSKTTQSPSVAIFSQPLFLSRSQSYQCSSDAFYNGDIYTRALPSGTLQRRARPLSTPRVLQKA